MWEYLGTRGLREPSSQSEADQPHPKAWTSWELNSRLKRERCIFNPELEYSQNEPDHPVLAFDVLTGPREAWREKMEAWVDDVEDGGVSRLRAAKKLADYKEEGNRRWEGKRRRLRKEAGLEF